MARHAGSDADSISLLKKTSTLLLLYYCFTALLLLYYCLNWLGTRVATMILYACMHADVCAHLRTVWDALNSAADS
jgi:hypothetical protein